MANSEVTIGQKIKKRCAIFKLTQDQLARKTNIPYTTLVKIKTGAVKSPSVDTMKKITMALDITIDELIK